jgi:aspartyl protease family protein
MLKNALIFAIGALVIGFAAPSFIGDRGAHVVTGAAASAPSAPAQSAHTQSAAAQTVADAEPASEYREATIAADAGGQYHTKVLIEGQDVDVMVDTGATVVALNAETAARLGVTIDRSQPRWRMTTANGVVFANPVTLKAVSLGAIYMPDVEAVVMPPGASSSNLLGASFLKRLVSVEQRGGMLVLRQ